MELTLILLKIKRLRITNVKIMVHF